MNLGNVLRSALVLPPIVLSAFTGVDRQPREAIGTFVENAPAQPAQSLTAHCPQAPAQVCVHDEGPLRENCQVVETSDLGPFDGTRYILARYLRSRTFDPGKGAAPDSCQTDEIVLAALLPDGRARVVWSDATEREFVFLSSAKLHRTPDGHRILAILYCMNGTGGCTQGALIWAGGAWRTLERDRTWDAVYRNVPLGYRTHKSPEIDFAKLTWEQHLAHTTDANCCPSGRIHFRLRLIDDMLGVESYRIVVPESEATERLVERLMAKTASEIDPALPPQSLETWLESLIPEGARRLYEINDCGEQTGDPALDRGRALPACLGMEVDLVSRERRLELSFDSESLSLRAGAILSPDLETPRNVAALSDLPALLVEPIRPKPLECPPATARHRKEEHAGSVEWCEEVGGRKQGPYRSWYSTGVYLMEKGEYRDGSKAGEWTECSRFERCALRSHSADVGVSASAVIRSPRPRGAGRRNPRKG